MDHSRRGRKQAWAVCGVTAARAWVRLCSSANRERALAARKRCLRWDQLPGPRGPAGGRSIFPVRRSVADAALAQLTLTRNRAANCSKPPSPSW
jgi:hypothetical protein